ncbi:hypothetical protein [Pseudogemmobacter sonorensis]|uniref:hypothetical protein n=1 Tax=Pseudogemmobacter sonorensis TaxID=2989681 RepID=UPI00369DF42E
MCEVCSNCERPGWQVPLRLSPSNETICILCYGVRGWKGLRPLDDLPEYQPGMIAPPATERRAA